MNIIDLLSYGNLTPLKSHYIPHEVHQRVVKKLLQEKACFPGIVEEVELGNWQIYYMSSKWSRKQTTSFANVSTAPRTMAHCPPIDFCGPFPTGECLLVVIDAYSHYPEVEVVYSTPATMLPKMDRIFATQEISRVARSDDGSPFSS